MLSWLAKKLISHNMTRLNAGDPGPTVRMDAEDVQMLFPGTSTWATQLRGKREHERWLQRFARVGIQIFADEVVVKGWPWKMTVCIRGHDYMNTPAGETVYENRYVLWGRLVWGKLKEYEVYEDTQKTEAFDEWLAEHEPGHPRAAGRAPTDATAGAAELAAREPAPTPP
jgi:ketosteroid isomerase-like protein